MYLSFMFLSRRSPKGGFPGRSWLRSGVILARIAAKEHKDRKAAFLCSLCAFAAHALPHNTRAAALPAAKEKERGSLHVSDIIFLSTGSPKGGCPGRSWLRSGFVLASFWLRPGFILTSF